MIGNTLVITAYGHDDVLDKIAINMFNENSNRLYRDSGNADVYCYMTNSLSLKEDKWVHAKIVPANTPFSLKDLLPVNFYNLILSMNDRSLQKVFREIDKSELTIAFMNSSEEVMEKVYKNISSTAKKMLQEDMEYNSVKNASKREIISNQEKIINIIRHLEDTGEIVFTNIDED